MAEPFIWKRGTINAHAMPNGTFISTDLQTKRFDLIRNNTEYRERIEKASRMAGFTPVELRISRGASADTSNIDAIVRQNNKAETLSKGKEDEKLGSGSALTCTV